MPHCIMQLIEAYRTADRLAAWNVEMMIRTKLCQPGSYKLAIAAEQAFAGAFRTLAA